MAFKLRSSSPVLQEKPKSKAANTAKKVTEATIIGKGLEKLGNVSKLPIIETGYDLYNLGQGLKEGDYKKVGANTIGALLPMVSGKAFEAVADDYLPATPKPVKEKMKAVLKGKRATPEQMRKAQSNNWEMMKKGFQNMF